MLPRFSQAPFGKKTALIIMVALLGFAWGEGAMAACTGPAGNAGQIIYNADYGKMQYCDGSSWKTMGNVPCVTNGLVSRWQMDDGTGTTATDSWGGNNGTLTNGPTWVTGINGISVQFDGVDDYVSIGDPAGGELDFGTNSFSVSLWVYVISAVGTSDMPIYKGGSSSSKEGYDMQLGSGTWNAGLSDGTTKVTAAYSTSALNTWIHLVMVIDRSSQYLLAYANGALANQTSIASIGSVSNAYNLTMGSNGGGGGFMHGKVDDVRIYNRALSATEIAALYNGGAGCF